MLDRPPASDRQRDTKRELRRARDRRRYQRRVAGLAVAEVEYSRDVVNYLVRWHWLDDSNAHDPRCIGDAIARAMQEAAEADRK
jgi:hypothetical protein